MAELAFVTIPFSHYCEKARWALDRAGLAYDERAHLPMAHWVPAKRAGGGKTVPVLVTPSGTLRDSTDILRWVDAKLPEDARLFPTDPALAADVQRWEDLFDDKLGPATRRWAYGHLLPDEALVRSLMRRNVPAYQGAAVQVLYPGARRLMARGMNINPAACARSLERMRSLFAEVSTALADGRRYLVGERFTAADLTFAALATPVLFPPRHARWLGSADELPVAMRETVDEFRATRAGAWALRLYAEERG